MNLFFIIIFSLFIILIVLIISIKTTINMPSNAYFWVCQRCNYRNSRLVDRCFSCRNPNLNLSSPNNFFDNQLRTITNNKISRATKSSSSQITAKKVLNQNKTNKSTTTTKTTTNNNNRTAKTNNNNNKQSNQQQFRKNIQHKITSISSRWSKTCIEISATADLEINKSKSFYRSLLSKCNGTPYIDDEFPTNRSSLYRINEDSDPQYDRLINKWLRIADIQFERSSNSNNRDNDDDDNDKICIHSSGLKVSDFRQGRLGDCWLLSSLLSLVDKHPEHLNLLIPDSKLHPNECVYQIFLCLDGKWTSVIIDDYFPCDKNNRLVFSAAIGHQLFAMMIEKALAKHYSCYKALVKGHTIEGFTTLTGMPSERIKFDDSNIRNSKQSQSQLWNRLVNIINVDHYLVAASCSLEKNGLHDSHAYSVLDICTTSNYEAILLANPWGDQQLHNQLLRNNDLLWKLGKQKSKHGLFWITFKDFIQYFSHIDICKYRNNWFIKRYEFRLPFFILDQKNFTIFDLNCSRKTIINFTIHQPIDRELKLKYRLSLSLAIFKVWPDQSIQLVIASPILSEKIENYETLLGRGRYLVVVFGFNHLGSTSRLKEAPTLVMAIHSMRKVDIRPINPDMHLMGDLLIQTVIKMGESNKINSHNDCLQYKLGNFAAFIFMIENGTDDRWLLIKYDTTEMQNAFNLRSNIKSVSVIPPGCRQIVCIMARESDKETCNYNCWYSAQLLSSLPESLNLNDELNELMDDDAEKMSVLFAPRSIQPNCLAEQNRNIKFNFAEESDGSMCRIC